MTPARAPVARFLGNATPLAIGQLGANVLLLVNTVLLARILGVQSYGLLAIGIAIYGLTAFLGDAGLGIWGLRIMGDDPDHWTTVIRVTIARTITLSVALALAFGAVLLLPLPNGAVAPSLVMVCAMVPLGFSVDWALVGLERTGRAAAGRFVMGAATVAFSPPLALTAGATGAAVGYVLATAVGCGVTWILLVGTIGQPRWVSPRGIATTLRRSFPMGASAVLNQIYWLSDSLLTGILLGSVAAGLYSAPMRLLAAVVGLGAVVGTSLLPVYRALDAAGPTGLSRLATSTTRLMILACVPAVGVAIGGASTIVTAVLGADFAGSAPVFAFGSITVAVWVCMVPVGYAILARRHDHRYLAATVAAVLMSLPLIVALGGAYGIGGVAVAMLVAQVVAAIVIAAGAARSAVRLKMAPVAVALTIAVAAGVASAFAAARAPWGIAGMILVGVLAEIPFAGVVTLEITGARRSIRVGETAP